MIVSVVVNPPVPVFSNVSENRTSVTVFAYSFYSQFLNRPATYTISYNGLSYPSPYLS